MKEKKPVTVTYGLNARQGMLKGADLAAKAIGTTFGPQGGIVILEKATGNIAPVSYTHLTLPTTG